MIDASCFVGTWPFRELALADAELLRARLMSNGVTHAVVSPAESVLHRSTQVSNRSWADRLAGDEFYSFVPVINPAFAGAADEVAAHPDATAIRLLPGPHGYELSDSAVVELVTTTPTSDRTVIVQIRMIDQRMAHPAVVHREVSPVEVRTFAAACPGTRIVVAGARPNEIVEVFAEPTPPQVWCDISHCEQPDVVRKLISDVGPDRLLCGTHAPIHVVEALGAKLVVADLTPEEAAALTRDNAVAAGLVRMR